MEFELVLPCYNESKSIKQLIERAISAAKKHGFDHRSFGLVLVENGSKDDSRAVMYKLRETELGDWFRVVCIDNNQGYGYGLWQGLSSTVAEYVSWSHADQQCDPNDAFVALKKLKSQRRRVLVKGKRFGRNWKDFVVSRVFETIASVLLGYFLFEINAQPKVFHRSLLEQVINPPYDFAFDLYVLYCARKNGYQIQTIQVEFPPRVHGLSNWAASFKSRFKHIKNMIIYIWKLSKERV
jgi:glycosyltransferase involved in cell wall biosynthesis